MPSILGEPVRLVGQPASGLGFLTIRTADGEVEVLCDSAATGRALRATGGGPMVFRLDGQGILQSLRRRTS